MLALAVLFYLWRARRGRRARPPRSASPSASGFSSPACRWVYVSLHDFGGCRRRSRRSPPCSSAPSSRCFPRAGGLRLRQPLGRAPPRWRALAAFPRCWTLVEWLRGWLFTGFPWLALGYSQVPASPLAGYAPLLRRLRRHARRRRERRTARRARPRRLEGCGRTTERMGKAGAASRSSLRLVPCAFGIWAAAGAAAGRVDAAGGRAARREPAAGQRPAGHEVAPGPGAKPTLETYRTLVAQAASPLVVLPETALPLFLDQVAAGLSRRLAAHARAQRRRHPGRRAGAASGTDDYYNSVVSLGASPHADLPQVAPRAVRRIHPAAPRSRAGSCAALAIPAARISRAARETSGRSRSPASASRSTSATRTRSARRSSASCPRRRCSSTSATSRGSATRSRRSSTCRSSQARAGNRPLPAARDQHRHHRRDRPGRRSGRRRARVRHGIRHRFSSGLRGRNALCRAGATAPRLRFASSLIAAAALSRRRDAAFRSLTNACKIRGLAHRGEQGGDAPL